MVDERQQSKKTNNRLWPYRVEPHVEIGKICLQMAAGVGIVALLALKVLTGSIAKVSYWLVHNHHQLSGLVHWPTLTIVGGGLAYSAGLDLAYMLFTPGLDEAIDPLISGVASAILFVVSKMDNGPSIGEAAAIGLFVLILACLFIMKEIFLKQKEEKDQSENTEPSLLRRWLAAHLRAKEGGRLVEP